MNIKPEISILIPAVNEAEIIADIIGHVCVTMDGLNRPYEILVIDDGSTDETALRAQNAGARVISHPYNIGNGAAGFADHALYTGSRFTAIGFERQGQ
jgi:glycosyltransferase involved in cell wall biosynthesis